MTGVRSPGPWVRVAAGGAGLLVSGLVVRRRGVGPGEQAVFRRVNDLPDRLDAPAWWVMQAGALGAVPVAAAAARVGGRCRTARRLLVSGTATWLLAKGVKRLCRRPRPTALLDAVHSRGSVTGLGFVSGHAGVAAALCSGAWPELSAGGRVTALVAAPLVGTARVYVGAHLPWDVVGGAALGLAVDGLVDITARGGSHRRANRARRGRRRRRRHGRAPTAVHPR